MFSNSSNLPLLRVEKMLDNTLLEGLYFNASSAGLPDLHFAEGSKALDHDWHEWHGLAETEEPVSDSDGRSIEQLIDVLQSQSSSRIR